MPAQARSPSCRFAMVMFHVFVGLHAVLNVLALPHEDMQTRLAAVGVGSAATMWFVADAMTRGREVPFMTLWTRCTFWYLLSPADYLSSRGRAGVRKLLLQGLLAGLVYGARARARNIAAVYARLSQAGQASWPCLAARASIVATEAPL